MKNLREKFCRLTIGIICCRSLVSLEILRLPACSKFDGQFSVEISGKVLAESTLLKLPAISFVECVFQCISHKKCKSVNFSEQKSDCELNCKDSRDKNITLKESDGWSYFETALGPVQNLGPHCLHFRPCKYGVCRDICEKPGYVCVIGDPYTSRCEAPPGSSAQSAAKSCYEIRKKCGAASPPSGRYWIMASFPIQMYCDMDVEGGGWTKVGNMNITSNSFLYSPSYVHDGIDTLNETEKSYYALSTAGLAKLHELINFTSIRIFCYKASVNRTLHIYTANNQSGLAVVNYMIGKNISRPASCESLPDELPDDRSLLSTLCTYWNERKWSIANAKATELLYDVTLYVPGKHHIITGGMSGRFECDDMSGTKIGTWMFFVR